MLGTLHMLIYFTRLESQEPRGRGDIESRGRVPRIPGKPSSPLATTGKMARSSCSVGRTAEAVELINSLLLA